MAQEVRPVCNDYGNHIPYSDYLGAFSSSEPLWFAAAMIIKPLDAPLAGAFAVFKDLGWL
jgi:hypothetical protein